MVGRWSDGVPLDGRADLCQDWQAFNAELAAAHAAEDKPKLAQIALKFTDFKYRPDPVGATCPVTSHLRRANPRDMLDPNFSSTDPSTWDGSALVNRRRILRRGLALRECTIPARGPMVGPMVASMASSSSRLLQPVPPVRIRPAAVDAIWARLQRRQRHLPDRRQSPDEDDPKLVITTDPATGKTPFICSSVPQLVEPRGGDYFFVPSMTALRMIGMGIIDPT
jgi:hypothetical protein